MSNRPVKVTAKELRKAVVEELTGPGFEWQDRELRLPKEQTKDFSRRVHGPARRAELRKRQDWLRERLPRYLPFFANGDEVARRQIRPKLAVPSRLSTRGDLGGVRRGSRDQGGFEAFLGSRESGLKA